MESSKVFFRGWGDDECILGGRHHNGDITMTGPHPHFFLRITWCEGNIYIWSSGGKIKNWFTMGKWFGASIRFFEAHLSTWSWKTQHLPGWVPIFHPWSHGTIWNPGSLEAFDTIPGLDRKGHPKTRNLLGCPRNLGSMVRINGLYITYLYMGYISSYHSYQLWAAWMSRKLEVVVFEDRIEWLSYNLLIFMGYSLGW